MTCDDVDTDTTVVPSVGWTEGAVWILRSYKPMGWRHVTVLTKNGGQKILLNKSVCAGH